MSSPTQSLSFNSSTPVADLVDNVIAKMSPLTLDISPTGFGTWSHSRLKQLINCPLQFLLKTVLKVNYTLSDEQKEDTEEQYWRYIGLAAHRILEDMVIGVPFLDSYAKHEAEFLPHLGEERWKNMIDIRDNLEGFCYRLERFDFQHTITKLTCEQKLAVNKDWNPVDFNDPTAFFRGILDLTAHLKNGDIALFDHKNGGEAKYGLKNYVMQLKSQSILVLSSEQDTRGVIPFIHFIQDGDVAGGKDYYSRTQVMEEFTVSLHSCIDGTLENLVTSAKFKHHPGSYCNYCDFQPICRGGKRGTANVLQPIVEKSKAFFRS